MRVELSEIEVELLKYPQIERCVADYRDSGGIDNYIAAYFVTKNAIATSDLRQFLECNLPDYMIPAYFVQIPEIPLTSNGKLDYRALPDPKKNIIYSRKLPANETERKLADIWCEILGVEQVGTDENFLHIGGNSLNIMSLVTKIFRTFEVELPLGIVFAKPTIEMIAEYISGSEKSVYSDIQPVAKKRALSTISSAKADVCVGNN